MKTLLFSFLALILVSIQVLSQGTDVRESKQSKVYFGLNIISAQTKIVNEGIINASALSISNRNSMIGSFEMGYCISRFIIINVGLGYSTYASHFSMDSIGNKFTATDSENESYERRVSGNGIKEDQKIAVLNIPACINFQVPLGEKLGLFMQAGVSFSIPINKSYSSSGQFTYTGYYPAYNVVLQNLPNHDFQSGFKNNVTSDLKLKSFNTDLLASCGIQFYLKQNVQLILGVYYSKSLNDVSGYTKSTDFHISEYANQMNSLMGSTSKATLESLGIRLGVRYYVW